MALLERGRVRSGESAPGRCTASSGEISPLAIASSRSAFAAAALALPAAMACPFVSFTGFSSPVAVTSFLFLAIEAAEAALFGELVPDEKGTRCGLHRL